MSKIKKVIAGAGVASGGSVIHLFKETMERSATPNIGEEKQKCPGRKQ
jgi:hypothetical protein